MTGDVIIYGGLFGRESCVDDGENVDVKLLDIGTEGVEFVRIGHAVNVDCGYPNMRGVVMCEYVLLC